MRFFKPYLSPSNAQLAITYSLTSHPLLYAIWIAGDLSELRLRCRPSETANRGRLKRAIKNELMEFPFPTSCRFQHDTLYVQSLVDIQFLLTQHVAKLKQQEPNFFPEFNDYLDELEALETFETDELQSTNATNRFIFSSLPRFQYFSLQACRQNGMQHTIEFPLKALEKNKFVSQAELDRIILPVWRRVNEIRAKNENHSDQPSPQPEFVPYVFSKTR